MTCGHGWDSPASNTGLTSATTSSRLNVRQCERGGQLSIGSSRRLATCRDLSIVGVLCLRVDNIDLHGSEVVLVHEVVCSQEHLEGPIFPHRPIDINMIHINSTVVVSKACGAWVGYASHGEEGGGSAFILGEIFSPGQIRLTPFGLRLALVGTGHGHCR